MKPTAGMFPGMNRQTYGRLEAINQSILKKVLSKSPAHALYEQLHPTDPTPAMVLGEAIHQAVLEPDRFENEFCGPAMDDEGHRYDKRTKQGKIEWKLWEEKNQGKTAISSADDWKAIHKIKRELWERAVTKTILGGPGQNEIAMVWQDPETGLWCKALLDRLQPRGGQTFLWDLKTTQSAHPRDFARQAADLGYHFQAGWYMWGAEVLFGESDARRFGFLAVEKEEPWAMKPYVCKPSVIEQGQLEAREALSIWAKCEKDQRWPDYGDEIEEFHLPPWAYREVEA